MADGIPEIEATEGTGSDESGRMSHAFEHALGAAEAAPQSDATWDHLEELADAMQRPDEVAALYRRALDRDLEREIGRNLARRAAAFYEAWYGDDPEAMQEVLTHIVTRDPAAGWAFERLTLVLTVAERWADLLGVYDRQLGELREPGQRLRLLDDAAHIAKDFAGRPDRAIEYMQLQLELDPGNHGLAAAIERLLEREQRWRDLIEHWQRRLIQLDAPKARQTRLRIATTYLDHLGAPEPALDELSRLVEEVPGHAEACAQMERVLAWRGAPGGLRTRALDLLRGNYEAAHRPRDVVAALRTAIGFAAGEERLSLLREAAERLGVLGEDEQALELYAALLQASPTDADARRQMRELAARSHLQAQFVEALEQASGGAEPAQSAALLLEAATLARTTLGDADRAADFYARVVDRAEAEPTLALVAAHQLNELLAAAGRDIERLDVLEQLAELESAIEVRRAVLGEAGRLADRLGDPDRALHAYARRLQADPHDAAALDATIDLLARHDRAAPLAEALRRRADAGRSAQSRRADLVRMAGLQAEALRDPLQAIQTWLEVRREFGDEPETTAALDRLMAEAEHWEELASILSGAASTRRLEAAGLLARLGEIHHRQLDRLDSAAVLYAQALRVQPENRLAREGARALTGTEATAKLVAEALAAAFAATREWDEWLGLVDVRVAVAEAPRDAVEILREAGRRYEQERDDPRAAQAVIARAFELDPADPSLESELERLAERAGVYSATAEAFARAAEASTSPGRAAAIRRAEGEIREAALQDYPGAVAAYAAAAELEPDNLYTLRAIIRASALAGTWTEATHAVVRICHTRDLVDESAMGALADAAAQRREWSVMLEALGEALDGSELPPPIARELQASRARWYRDEPGDLEAARDAAARAVAHDPHRVEILELLADLERRLPQARSGPRPPLVDTLLGLDALRDHDLDPLREAAELALEDASSPPRARELLSALFRKASRLLLQAHAVQGAHAPEETVAWALDHLVRLELEERRVTAAIAILRAATELPLGVDRLQEIRLRTARLSVEAGALGDAIDLLRRVLIQRPDDLELVRELAELCQREDRLLELVALRSQELELTEDPERRLALRLELSRLTGAIEQRGGRVAALRQNLEEEPGHRPSMDALTAVLRERGQLELLAEVLRDQAQRLETHDRARAAELWSDLARLAEQDLADLERAVLGYERVIALAPSHDARDQLARLHGLRNEPGKAAATLAARLQDTEPEKRVPVLLKLARAQVAAGREDEAIETLQTAFTEAPKSAEARNLLIRLRREHGQWEPLAETLTAASAHVNDGDTLVAYAKEAAALFADRLGEPERAVPILERASPWMEGDREMSSRWVEALRAAGRLQEARAAAEALIESFGRRRSPERAAAHLRLARVAHAQGDAAEALDQLEKASTMDASSHRILRTLAETALEAGQLERSERAWRALLLQVKRRPPALQDVPGDERIGAAEVLYQLSHIAQARGDEVQAQELVESAMEALAFDDAEGPPLQAALRRSGQHDLLHRVLQTRLQNLEIPHLRAALLGELATLQEDALRDAAAALGSRLAAIEIDPSAPEHHERARALAAHLGRTDEYIGFVEGLLEKARRPSDVYARCELLLRLAEVTASDRGDAERAGELLAEAEALGVREVDVWRSAARIAAARGDAETHGRYLDRLAALGESEDESRADAMYRMAEVQLASEESPERGLETLQEALETDARPERAARILARATAQHEHADMLALFERMARRVDDPELLLLAIERRAATAAISTDALREGVELATSRGEPDRAQSLMARAVELARETAGERPDVGWALRGLAEHRLAAGDLAAAAKWLCEAIEAAPSIEDLLPRAAAFAEATAREAGDPTLAIKVFEALRERDPGQRAVWEPLAELYREVGDLDRLTRLVEETLDGVDAEPERHALRLQLARTLLAHAGREDHALSLLRAIVTAQPEHPEARVLLAEVLERTGRAAELEGLWQEQLAAAQGRDDTEAIVGAARRLAKLQAATDSARAAETLRSALPAAPHDPALLQELLELLGEEDDEERSTLLRTLVSTASGPALVHWARRLADLCARRGDEDGEVEALKAAYTQVPEDEELRERLEAAYARRADHRGLAELLLHTARDEGDAARRATLFRQAAAIHRDQLLEYDFAAEILERAHAATPEDPALALELVSLLTTVRQLDRAAALLAEMLEEPPADAHLHLQLRLARTELREHAGDVAGMIEDLVQALPLDRDAVVPRLMAVMQRELDQAAARRDVDAERALTLQMCDVLLTAGERDQARALLEAWVERERKDVGALELLRDLEAADERWESVSRLCARLVAIESGPAKIQAALALWDACQRMGRPADARPGLEHARRKEPESVEIRRALIDLYETIQADGELAKLLAQEAEETTEPGRRLDVLRRVASLHLRQGDPEAALPALQEILTLAPDDLAATVGVVDHHLMQHQLDVADEVLDRAIGDGRHKRAADLATLYQRKAHVAAVRGDVEAQIAYLQQAFTTDKNNGLVMGELADIAEAHQQWDLAIRVLRTITLSDAPCPISRTHAFLRQARIAEHRGDRQRAILWARKAKHEDPSDPQVSAFLQALDEGG